MGLLFNSRGFSIRPTCLKSFAMFSSLDANVIVRTEHGLGSLCKEDDNSLVLLQVES